MGLIYTRFWQLWARCSSWVHSFKLAHLIVSIQAQWHAPAVPAILHLPIICVFVCLRVQAMYVCMPRAWVEIRGLPCRVSSLLPSLPGFPGAGTQIVIRLVQQAL